MGYLDQLAKDIFAEETAALTSGGAVWVPPLELGLSDVRLDGMLRILDSSRLSGLAEPWPSTCGHDEFVMENKMQGDHLDGPMLQRALLRRQVRNVQRAEDPSSPWDGEEPLWIVAPRMPEMLRRRRSVKRFAPGCYHVRPASFQFVWIAANELPLVEELIPFLVARSGLALEEFVRWVAPRRPREWVLRMVQVLPMSTSLREEMRRYVPQTDDPEVRARQRYVAKMLLDMDPELRKEVGDEERKEGREDGIKEGREDGIKEGLGKGRLVEARAALRRVLARRELSLAESDGARIDACEDLALLERWHDQAIVATSAADALR